MSIIQAQTGKQLLQNIKAIRSQSSTILIKITVDRFHRKGFYSKESSVTTIDV